MESGLQSANFGDKWSTETIFNFLEEYKNHPCLWDCRNRLYKCKSERIAAEIEILNKLKLQYLDLNVFRSKVRNIRNTYRQEVMKIMKNSKPEAGAEGVFVPKLRWFNLADSFLRKTLELNEVPTVHKHQEEVTSEPVDDSSALEFEDVKPNLVDLRVVDPPWNQPQVRDNPPKRAYPWDGCDGAPSGGGGARDEEKPDSGVESQQSSVERRASAEFDAFGKYVSLQLQQLPLDVAVELEMEIVNLICRKRLRLLREESELPAPGIDHPY